MWIILGGHLNGGVVPKWFQDNYFPHLSYKDFDNIAEGIPAGSEGVIFLPYLSGERTPYQDPSEKGIYYSITLQHTYKHMIRAVMEGVILAMRLSLEIFKELNLPINQVIASGGGAKSGIWLQMQADIFQTTIYTIAGKEESCIGAAIIAGVGVHLYQSIEQACSILVQYNQKVTWLNVENAKIYDEAFEKFKLLYQNNKNLF